MSQNKELDAIKRRIKALTETQGFTEVELTHRMEKVGELLEQYGLSMSDIDIREQACRQDYVTFGQQKRNKATTLMVGIAEFTSTKCWSSVKTNSGKKEIRYYFFGQESDVDAAKYLMDICYKTMVQETVAYTSRMGKQDVRGEKRVAQTCFQEAFADRVYKRFVEMKEKLDQELAAKAATGRSLIVLKNQLVEQEWAKEGIRLRQIRYYHSRGWNGAANRAGNEAGNRINLQRPLESGRNKLLLS